MNKKIDFQKPIIAENNRGNKYLLVVQLAGGNGYTIKGYNWLSLQTMKWNSCCCFSTIEEALETYQAYKIYNGKLKVSKIK